MSNQVNVIFALHFDDDNDPRYKEICKLVMSAEMWTSEKLVTAKHCNGRDEMLKILGDDDE